MYCRSFLIVAFLALQVMLGRSAFAHEPRSDGSCPLLWPAKDSQGFCWTWTWNVPQHDEEYRRLRAAGLAPPTPSTLTSQQQPSRVNPLTVPVPVPHKALSSIGENNFNDCLKLAQNNFGTEQECRDNYARAKAARRPIEGSARTLSSTNPALALMTDPKGSFCDKAIELVTHDVLNSERLTILARSYGVYDTIKKAFKPSVTERKKSFLEEVMEACHIPGH